MIDFTRRFGAAGAALSLMVAVAFGLSGCTVIRYVDPPGGGGGGGGGGNGPPPKVVDVLIQADLRKSASAFGSDYQKLLGQLSTALADKNVSIRRLALAPMYRRAGSTAPLVFGRGDEKSDFSTLGEAYTFYTRDDGAQHLTDRSSVDGENLAALGLSLDSRSIYHPKSADPSSRAYFKQPKDGFIVVSMTASARRCAASSSSCRLDGEHPAEYFTGEKSGGAAWLNLPGDESLPPSKIYHLAVATAEGDLEQGFYEHCTSYPRFPKSQLDYMEHSPKKYYGPLTKRIDTSGGHGTFVDLCRALSSDGKAAMKQVARDIRKDMF